MKCFRKVLKDLGTNGKENGDYYNGIILRIMEKKMETTAMFGFLRCYR